MDDKGIKYKKLEFLENKYYRKLKICDIRLKNYEDEKEIIKCENHSITNLLNRMTDKHKDINKKIEDIQKKKDKYNGMISSINKNKVEKI